MRYRTWFAYSTPIIFFVLYVWEIRRSDQLFAGLVPGLFFILAMVAVFFLACYHLWHKNWRKGILGLVEISLLAACYMWVTSNTESPGTGAFSFSNIVQRSAIYSP